MSKNNDYNIPMDELISEIEKELEEATTTGDVGGFDTPNAFSNGSQSDKKRKKKIATVLGYEMVGTVDESNKQTYTKDNMKKSLFMESIRETLLEDSEYQKFFKMALIRTGKKIPEMSEDEKKEFFNKIEKSWNSKGEKGKDGKIDESDSKIKMNNLDWGKTTSERNSNLDKFEKLSSEKEKNAFMLKLKGKNLNEGVMGDIDVIAHENDNFKSFAKEVLHDYPKLPKDKGTMTWLKGLWDSRTQRENIEEGNDSSAAGVFYAENEKGYVQGDTVKFFKTYTGAKRYYMKFSRTPESDEYDRFGSHVMDKNFFQTHTHYDWKGNPGFKKVEKFVQESTINEVGGYKIKANSKKIIDLFVKGYFKDAVSAHKGGAWFVDLAGGRKLLRGPNSIVAEYKNGKLIIGTSYGNVSQTVINYINKFAKKNGIATVSKNLDESLNKNTTGVLKTNVQ